MNLEPKSSERNVATRFPARRVAHWSVLLVALGQSACEDDPEPWVILDASVDGSVTADGAVDVTPDAAPNATTGIPTGDVTVHVDTTEDIPTEPVADASQSMPPELDASATEGRTSAEATTGDTVGSTAVTGGGTSGSDGAPSSETGPATESSEGAESLVDGGVGDAGDASVPPLYTSCFLQCSLDCYPDCLQELFAGCAPSGSCNEDEGSYCWGNQTTATETGDAFSGYARTIFAPGGAECYRAESSIDVETFIATYSWSDAASNVVATASWDLTEYTMQLTCVETGTVWSFEPPNDCDTLDDYGWSLYSCESGACPIQGDAGTGTDAGESTVSPSNDAGVDASLMTLSFE